MKRKISLVILILSVLALTLSACGSTSATSVLARWEEEKHVFNITLADFQENSDSFKVYPATAADGSDSYKDIAFNGEFSNRDEIKPLAVNGTYTIEIKPSADKTSYCDVETVQEMCVNYRLKTGDQEGVDLTKYSELQSAVATADQLKQFGMTSDESTITLYSYTKTSVRFENTTQNPLNSSTTVKGFYVGKKNQNLTQYTVSTDYDYTSSKRPVAKITLNGETSEFKFAKNSAGSFIDSNQILLYLRSLNKSSSSFQDSPSISVFNPYTQTLQTANFGMSYEYNLILTDTTREDSILAAKLNLVSVTVGNNAFMMQENLPDKLAEKKLDVYSTLSGPESKFTTVRFRVGYLAYEIDYTNPANTTKGETTNWSGILEALSPTKTEE